MAAQGHTPISKRKIDCYEKGSDYVAGAETPGNSATTDRVRTILLAEEY